MLHGVIEVISDVVTLIIGSDFCEQVDFAFCSINHAYAVTVVNMLESQVGESQIETSPQTVQHVLSFPRSWETLESSPEKQAGCTTQAPTSTSPTDDDQFFHKS